MNAPRRVLVDRRGRGKSSHEAEDLTRAKIESICTSLANHAGLEFHPDTKPGLSTLLPQGHRFECLVGPSVQSGLSLAIRCKHPFKASWDSFGLDKRGQAYLQQAVLREANIIVSGATNTGKTTLLNMILALVDESRRLIAVENTPELEINRFWDGLGLLAAREADSASTSATSRVGWRQLYDHLMRITPDHIVFGEISTQNAFAMLAALNSGATGLMCTLHAESPQQAIRRKFTQNMAWAGLAIDRVPEFLSELVDIVIQIKRSADGFRKVTEIYEPRHNRSIFKDGAWA